MAERTPWRMAPTPGRTALVVVDMQNAFCRDEGSTALIGLDAARLKAAVAPRPRRGGAGRRGPPAPPLGAPGGGGRAHVSVLGRPPARREEPPS